MTNVPVVSDDFAEAGDSSLLSVTAKKIPTRGVVGACYTG
jgi:hypothetical protein